MPRRAQTQAQGDRVCGTLQKVDVLCGVAWNAEGEAKVRLKPKAQARQGSANPARPHLGAEKRPHGEDVGLRLYLDDAEDSCTEVCVLRQGLTVELQPSWASL